MSDYQSALTYSKYLAIDELLNLQRPLSDGPEHDELLFITIHQTYELWFKQILHEITKVQSTLEWGDTYYSLSLLGRIRTIFAYMILASLPILVFFLALQKQFISGLTAGAIKG